jgi:hypothetical protein
VRVLHIDFVWEKKPSSYGMILELPNLSSAGKTFYQLHMMKLDQESRTTGRELVEPSADV